MTLDDVLKKIKNSGYLLTVNGVCDEWIDGAEYLPQEDYYEKYKNNKIISIMVLSTNDMPELWIEIEQ